MEDSGKIFEKLKEDVTTYIELKFEFLKLSTYERTGKVVALLSYGLIFLFAAFFAFLFIFLALGFFLGELFHSTGLGFTGVSLLYILFIIAIVLNKEKIQDKVQNEVIAALTANDEKDNDDTATTNEQQATPDASGETSCRQAQSQGTK